jgi:hypothetical protein
VSERRAWPIVVGGCHRSGTSVVRRILDAHPRIHCGPEVTFFRDFYGAYGEDPLAHLRFARTVRDLVPEEDALDVLGRAFVELHERSARRAGKPRWADKAPENVLYTAEWDRILDGRYVLVQLVRNPLDTVASMHGRFPLTLPDGLESRIEMYRTYTEAGLAFGRAHPERYMRVVYEDLCGEPAAVVRQLMEWLGEELDLVQLAFNAVPHEVGLEDPEVAGTDRVHAESVGRWRSTLGEKEATLVWERTRGLWAAIDPEGRHVPALVRGSP